MVAASLVPHAFYWAKSSKYFDGRPTIVRVSTVFGEDSDYWTLALLGTDQHAMPADFEIIAPAELPEEYLPASRRVNRSSGKRTKALDGAPLFVGRSHRQTARWRNLVP